MRVLRQEVESEQTYPRLAVIIEAIIREHYEAEARQNITRVAA